MKTAAPFGNVEVRWDWKKKREGVEAERILEPGMERVKCEVSDDFRKKIKAGGDGMEVNW